MMNEDLVKEVVAILSADEDEDGYGYDTVEAKHAVINLFSLFDNGDAEKIAEYLSDKGLI